MCVLSVCVVPVEGAPEHFLRDGHLEHVALKLAPREGVVDTRRALKDLEIITGKYILQGFFFYPRCLSKGVI